MPEMVHNCIQARQGGRCTKCIGQGVRAVEVAHNCIQANRGGPVANLHLGKGRSPLEVLGGAQLHAGKPGGGWAAAGVGKAGVSLLRCASGGTPSLNCPLFYF